MLRHRSVKIKISRSMEHGSGHGGDAQASGPAGASTRRGISGLRAVDAVFGAGVKTKARSYGEGGAFLLFRSCKTTEFKKLDPIACTTGQSFCIRIWHPMGWNPSLTVTCHPEGLVVFLSHGFGHNIYPPTNHRGPDLRRVLEDHLQKRKLAGAMRIGGRVITELADLGIGACNLPQLERGLCRFNLQSDRTWGSRFGSKFDFRRVGFKSSWLPTMLVKVP